MAALAMNLLPMFLGNGGGGISDILGNVTGAFGGLISGVGNTISSVGGNTNMSYTQSAAPKSNKTMFIVIGSLSVVMILGTVLIVVKKK
jgi:F0F1-type ATP synthase membrane subunit c/vacuolar-type H+-ATPase subunit K